MHLVDSLGRNKDLEYVCCLHEQAAALAAEAYAEYTGKPSVVLVTTGPGGTNALTGVAAAWMESAPVIFISGQMVINIPSLTIFTISLQRNFPSFCSMKLTQLHKSV